MGRTSKLRYGAVVAAGAAAMMLGTSCAAVAGEAEPEVVVIGVDLELTGEGSDLGEVFRDAIELRVEQVNQQQLLGQNRRLELEVTDNRSDHSTAVANLESLAADPSVTAIISGACDECVVRAADTLNEQGVPTVSLGRSDDVAQPVAERRYIFKIGPNANHNAAALAGELERAEVRSIALVASADRYGDDGMREMTQAAERAGIEVGISTQVTGEEESLAAAAAEIAAYQPPDPGPADPFAPAGPGDPAQAPDQAPDQPAGPQVGPDGVVVWAPEPAAGNLALALREQDYDGSLFLEASAADELFLTGPTGEALDGARLVFTETLVIDEVIATSPAKAARRAWFNDYTAQVGTYHAHSAFAADAVEVLVEAVNLFDDPERDTVRDALEGTLIDGFSGPIRLRLENHSGLSPQTLTTLVAQGDRWRLAAG